MNTRLRMPVSRPPALLSLLVCAAALHAARVSQASPATEERDRPGWEVAASISGAWSRHEVEAGSGGATSLSYPSGSVCSLATPWLCGLNGPTLSPARDHDLDGFEIEAGLRIWPPFRLGAARPWLEAGYRHSFDDFEVREAGHSYPADLRLVPLRIEKSRSYSICLGLEHPLLPRLIASVTTGVEFGEFETRVQPQATFSAWRGVNRDTLVAILVGLDLRVPLYDAGGVKIDAVGSAGYARWLGGKRDANLTFGTTRFRTPFEAEDSVRTRLGLMLRL